MKRPLLGKPIPPEFPYVCGFCGVGNHRGTERLSASGTKQRACNHIYYVGRRLDEVECMFLTEARPRVAANADVAQTTVQPATRSASAPIQANTPTQATPPSRPNIQTQPTPAAQTNVPPVVINPDDDELPF